MADTHYPFDRNTPAGFRLGRLLEEGEAFLNHLVAERDTMLQMRSGDGSADAHYAGNTAAYGFAADADAKAAFLQVDTLYSKVATDGATSGVLSTLRQVFAQLRS